MVITPTRNGRAPGRRGHILDGDDAALGLTALILIGSWFPSRAKRNRPSGRACVGVGGFCCLMAY